MNGKEEVSKREELRESKQNKSERAVGILTYNSFCLQFPHSLFLPQRWERVD